jgi:hypothetical protein
MDPELKTLVHNLSWTPALVDGCRAWRAACRDLLEQRFGEHCGRSGKLDWMLTAFAGLPEQAREEFMFSPAVSNQLLIRDPGHVPVFSALAGDFVRVLAQSAGGQAVDPDLAELLRPFGRDHGDVHGIPLDLDSAFSFPSRGACAGGLRAVPAELVVPVKRSLAAALDALGQGNPVALQCVCLLTQHLAIREEASRPDGCASSSFGHYIGLTLLTNTWSERVDVARLIDALVHESIHAALFLHEAIQGPLVLDRSRGDGLRSPRTGNPLNCYQYVQACFVWFGLSQLWRRWPAEAGGVPCRRSGEMHRRASQGFEARPVEGLRGHPGWCLVAPPAQEALRLLEALALDSWGS